MANILAALDRQLSGASTSSGTFLELQLTWGTCPVVEEQTGEGGSRGQCQLSGPCRPPGPPSHPAIPRDTSVLSHSQEGVPGNMLTSKDKCDQHVTSWHTVDEEWPSHTSSRGLGSAASSSQWLPGPSLSKHAYK